MHGKRQRYADPRSGGREEPVQEIVGLEAGITSARGMGAKLAVQGFQLVDSPTVLSKADFYELNEARKKA